MATATCCTENKALLIAQPLAQSENSLCKQQAFGDLLCTASMQLTSLLQNLDTVLCRCLVLPYTLGLPGYRFLPYLCVAKLERLGCAFTIVSLWHHQCLEQCQDSADSEVAFTGDEVPQSSSHICTAAVPSLTCGVKLSFWGALARSVTHHT